MDINRLLPRSRQKAAPADFELWPEHALAWSVYLACGTQWVRTAGAFGGERLEGLNYSGVDVVMRLHRVPTQLQEEVFQQLQVLEVETVKVCRR